MHTPSRKSLTHQALPSQFQYSECECYLADMKQLQNFFNFLSYIKEQTKQIRSTNLEAYNLFKASARFNEFVS